MMNSAPHGRRPDIDGLRAIAVLAVILFHMFPSVMPGGFIGVDVFFVISGYLISGSIFKDLDIGRFSFLNFYARRLRRILPALLIVLASAWILGRIVLLSKDFANLGKHIAAGAAFVSNFLLWRESGYFDTAAELKPLLHLWSLAVEEQYYLTWPILAVLWHRRKWSVPTLIGMLLLTSFAYNLWRSGLYGSAAFYLLPSRYWELMIGCGLAYSERGLRPGSAAGGEWKSAAAAVLFAAGLLVVNGSTAYPGAWALFPTLAALLFISAGPEAWLNRRVLSSAPATLVGRISYPLYLWHWPLLSLARIMEDGTPSLEIRMTIVFISFVLAWLTWRLVEFPLQTRPFWRMSSKRREGFFVCAGIATLVFFCCAGLWTQKRYDPVRRREGPEMIRKEAEWHKFDGHPCNELYGIPFDAYCWTTYAAPQAIIWGDSHAAHLNAGLSPHPDLPGIPLLQLGRGNCPALMDVDRFVRGLAYGCLPAFDRAMKVVDEKFPGVGVVVLSSQIPWEFEDGRAEGDEEKIRRSSEFISTRPDERELSTRDIVKEGFSRTISHLESAGKTVVFVIDVPEMDFDPRTCLDARPMRLTQKRPRPCKTPLGEVRARQREYRKIVAELAARHPRMRVFDPLRSFCDEKFCYAFKDGELLYRDPTHLTDAGSRRVGKPLLKLLKTILAERDVVR